MSTLQPHSQKPGRARLIAFRSFAALLLLFSFAGAVALGIGVFFTFRDSDHIGLIPATFLLVMAAAMLLLVTVSFRALKVRSIRELEEQSKSASLEKMAMRLLKSRLER
jgi:hypothetical protein